MEFDWTGVVDYSKRATIQVPKTQYELPGVTAEDHQGVPVAVVPLWHAVVTAKIAFEPGDQRALAAAQQRLAAALAEIERVYPLSPSGIFIQVAYGLPYFRDRIPTKLTDEHFPKSTLAGSEGEWAVIDSIRFPKDPSDLVLEENDICFHFKSDFRSHIGNVIGALFRPGEQELNGLPAERVYVGDLLTLTSVRHGFAGHGLPKVIGQRLGIPGAEHVPDGSMLFMGFTSSHVHGLAGGNLPSFETLPGYTDVGVEDYFAGGTAMHLSHIAVNLDEWYAMGPKDRLHRMFHPRRTEEPEVLSPDQAPATSTFEQQRDQDAEEYGMLGHNEQMQLAAGVDAVEVRSHGAYPAPSRRAGGPDFGYRFAQAGSAQVAAQSRDRLEWGAGVTTEVDVTVRELRPAPQSKASRRPAPRRNTRPRLPGTIAEIEGSPAGAHVGAFFDFDGTLIAGFSATAMTQDRWRNRDVSLGDLAKTIKAAAQVGAGVVDVGEFMRIGVESWRGRMHEDMVELGDRIFTQKIADTVFPEAKELVRAHQRQGHTVVLTSSAIPYQVEPMAKELGVDAVLCTRLEIKDGLLTGKVDGDPLWGAGKAEAVQRFAQLHGIDLNQSYFYADGNEDLALMHLVGKPRPTNPGKELEAVARRRGWPVQRFSSRGRITPAMRVRSLAGFASVVPIAVLGGGLGVLKRDKRAAINFVSGQWFRRMFDAVGVRLTVVGEENLWSHRPAVFIFNHRTNLDAFIAAALVREDFSGVAKKELAKDPIIGTLARFGDIAFVDRGNTAKAIESLEPLVELTRNKKLSILASPEGTRVVGDEVGPFKKGPFRMAMAAQVPIVPIVIRNADVLGPRNASVIRPGNVDVAVLPPISVNGWTLDDLPERIEEVRQQFIDTLEDWPG